MTEQGISFPLALARFLGLSPALLILIYARHRGFLSGSTMWRFIGRTQRPREQ